MRCDEDVQEVQEVQVFSQTFGRSNHQRWPMAKGEHTPSMTLSQISSTKDSVWITFKYLQQAGNGLRRPRIADLRLLHFGHQQYYRATRLVSVLRSNAARPAGLRWTNYSYDRDRQWSLQCRRCLSAMIASYAGTTNKVGNGFGIFFMFLYLAFQGTGCDTTMYLWVSEIFPTEIRSIGIGFSLFGQFASTIVLLQTAPIG
ncbi:uncharacterized protein MYCFIDRAFT_211329 [Pseudocercospora fijiensis CIRAD86]|uniref:Major facilitator superfamily (MFS) profile domain-containing protein n=1 Tax=Pseudocercospora fijiensis (strain CIRAD86) TaxID=383855 RepID=M3AFP0_PSEFD|nr:uncharacterized protein MYCFIDRAFT_211329 [Pseudocercospora fijiensis CIRAD86]EME83411.1 hypothetical protein MYCFIDRAFT_211329 [Pseudocercospora fijiensis CIRAD86]